jgi:hypothetical protein
VHRKSIVRLKTQIGVGKPRLSEMLHAVNESKVRFQRESFPQDFPDHAASRTILTDVAVGDEAKAFE